MDYTTVPAASVPKILCYTLSRMEHELSTPTQLEQSNQKQTPFLKQKVKLTVTQRIMYVRSLVFSLTKYFVPGTW